MRRLHYCPEFLCPLFDPIPSFFLYVILPAPLTYTH